MYPILIEHKKRSSRKAKGKEVSSSTYVDIEVSAGQYKSLLSGGALILNILSSGNETNLTIPFVGRAVIVLR